MAAIRPPLFTAQEIDERGPDAALARDLEALFDAGQIEVREALPVEPVEVEARLLELLRGERSAPRARRLRLLVVRATTLPTRAEADFLGEFDRRDEQGPRLTRDEWRRGRELKMRLEAAHAAVKSRVAQAPAAVPRGLEALEPLRRQALPRAVFPVVYAAAPALWVAGGWWLVAPGAAR